MDHRSTIRCSTPDCDWGFEMSNFDRMDECYAAYQQHCMEIHNAGPDSYIHFDLEKLMLSVILK